MTDRSNFLCLDCGVDTGIIDHYYMIHDDLWLSVNPGNDGMLCLWCLESRLGRPLSWADFPDLPVNTMGGFGEAFDQFVIIRELPDEEKNIFRQKIIRACREFLESRDKGNDRAEMGQTIPRRMAQQRTTHRNDIQGISKFSRMGFKKWYVYRQSRWSM